MLCADKNLTYDLVRVVEKSGLKVGDIFLDNYASCYEAALFEQSFNNYLINIYMQKYGSSKEVIRYIPYYIMDVLLVVSTIIRAIIC